MVKYHSSQWLVFMFVVTFGVADIIALISLLGFVPFDWAMLYLVASTPVAMAPVFFDLHGGFEWMETRFAQRERV